jgi:hypothetical protein
MRPAPPSVRYADCKRTNGVPNFPDPVSSPPANPAGFAMAFGRPSAYIVIPDALHTRSPAFRRVAVACRLAGHLRRPEARLTSSGISVLVSDGGLPDQCPGRADRGPRSAGLAHADVGDVAGRAVANVGVERVTGVRDLARPIGQRDGAEQ